MSGAPDEKGLGMGHWGEPAAHGAGVTSAERATSPVGTRWFSNDMVVPDTIGAYRVDKSCPAMRGGMGIVYRAHNVEGAEGGALVAIKVMQGAGNDAAAQALFESEAEKAGMSRHPNVVRVLGAGQFHDGSRVRPYYVMEWLDDAVSATDERLLRRLDIRGRVRLMLEICRTVAHIHESGVIHGDLKPSNAVVADWRGEMRVKVLDFGLARATRGWRVEQLPAAGATFEYAAPELRERGYRDPDARSDVYALGVMLREVLMPAWEGQRHVLVDGRLRRIVAKATANLFEGAGGLVRYAGAKDLVRELEKWLESPVWRAWGRWNGWALRRPAWAMGVVAAGVFAVAGYGIGELIDGIPLFHRDSRLVLPWGQGPDGALRNVRVITLGQRELPEALERAGVPAEQRNTDYVKRRIWAAVIAKLSEAGPKVVAADLVFEGPSAHDGQLRNAIDTLKQKNIPMLGMVKSWDSSAYQSTLSPAIYRDSDVVIAPATLLVVAGSGSPPPLAVPISVAKPADDGKVSERWKWSFALATAAKFHSPNVGEPAMRFDEQALGLIADWRSVNRGGLGAWTGLGGMGALVKGTCQTAITSPEIGIGPQDRVVYNLCEPGSTDDAFLPSTYPVTTVLAARGEQLFDWFGGRVAILGDATDIGGDTLKDAGRPNLHGSFFQALAIDQLITAGGPKTMSGWWYTVLLVLGAVCGVGLGGMCAALVRGLGVEATWRKWVGLGVCAALVGVASLGGAIWAYSVWQVLFPPTLLAIVGVAGVVASLALPSVRRNWANHMQGAAR